MNRPEPAEVKQARNTFGISPVRLDRHCLQRTLHLTGFHQDDIQTCPAQPTVQPLRQGPSFEADRGNSALLFSGPTHQDFRFTGDLRLIHDLAMLANHANCCL